MHVYAWLSPRNSTTSVKALIEVPAGEAADFDKMVEMVNGSDGHFGARVELVKVGAGVPEIIPVGKRYFDVKEAGGYSGDSRKQDRYFVIRILRD